MIVWKSVIRANVVLFKNCGASDKQAFRSLFQKLGPVL
jgi:hypothetical protein